MQLIFIYGPPAAGKLTVGRELQKLTGFRLFHNQLTVLVAKSLFPGHQSVQPNEHYAELLRRMRLDALEIAAEAGVNTIFTMAYSGKTDEQFIEHVVDRVRRHGGRVHFVQLMAPDEVLLQRVADQGRKEIAKISDPELLRQVLSSRTMHETIAHHMVYKIDTAITPASEAAKQIVAHFKLLDKE